MKKYYYTDSVAGPQTESFEKLSDLIKYLEDFKPAGDSTGIILEGERALLTYASYEDGTIDWRPF